jgi:hypothetical protein
LSLAPGAHHFPDMRPYRGVEFLRRALVVLAISAAARSTSLAQSIRVVDDPRAEVIGILFRIAGISDFRGGSVEPFIHQVDSAFAPFASHPVFAEVRKLRAADERLALSAVIGIAPQLSDPITFRERVPFDSPGSLIPAEWHGAAARPFLTQARDFAQVAHLADFLRFEQPTFDSASARMQRSIDTQGLLKWLGAFYGEPVGQVIVSPLLISSSGNFGAGFVNGATLERYAFVGVQVSDRAGFPVSPAEALEQTVHELSHSFVNPVVIADSMRLRAAAQPTFTAVKRSMNDNGYDKWLTMTYESLVRASVIRFLLATKGREAALREIHAQQGRGFVWMDQLDKLLGEYEAHRSTYPTFASFMPRVAAFYDSIAPRVVGLRADFESHRPRVLSASIENRAAGVDPALKQIVIRFDHAVHGFGDLVGDFGGDIPSLTGGSFDATGTVLTLGVRLVANHAYWLPFGPGSFADADGYPLQTWELRFKTRSE